MAAELHHPARRRYARRRIIVFGVDQEWSSDLLDVQKFASQNDGVRYVMVLQDVFTRYLWLFPLKNKQQTTILACLRSLFDKGVRCRRYFLCDNGTEFTGGEVVAFLRRHGVSLMHNYGEHKASLSERTCRFVAGRLYRYMTQQNDSVWLPWLTKIAADYNKTRQRRTGLSPTQARMSVNTARVFDANFKERKIVESRRVFKVGDLVRVSHVRSVFSKGYHQSYSTQQYVVAKVIDTVPKHYLLKDLQGRDILGGFYAEEMIPSRQTQFYYEVLKTRTLRNGKRQAYVHWSGHPESQDSWIYQSDLEDVDDDDDEVDKEKKKKKNATTSRHQGAKNKRKKSPIPSTRTLRSTTKR